MENIDPTNIDSLIRFFKENPNFHNWELATIANRSIRTITKWKRKVRDHLGNAANEFLHNNKVPFKRYRNPKKKVATDLPDDVWDNKYWFHKQYVENGHGVFTIGRMIGRPHMIVLKRLKKYGIETREPPSPKNPCHDPEWLYHHYGTKEDYVQWCWRQEKHPRKGGGKTWSIGQCAKAAGVSHTTMNSWLVKHGMKIRDRIESTVASKHASIAKLYDCGDSEL